MAVYDRSQTHRLALSVIRDRVFLHRRFVCNFDAHRAADAPGGLGQAETYNKLFTMHGVMMVFFFLIPSIPAVLGNFLVPMMIGARDLAFPRLNLASWYIFIWRRVHSNGGGRRRRGHGMDILHAVQQHLFQYARGAHGGRGFYHRLLVDFDRTQLHRHHPQNARARHDLVSPAAFYLVDLRHQHHFYSGDAGDRHHAGAGGTGTDLSPGDFDPALGGDPLLFQHLFWFYSHPAVYIMILPAMGVVSELIACFSRKRIFGYGVVAFSSLAIAVIGFLVWGHHMFVAGQSVHASMIFSLLSFLVAVPSAVKVFNWTATLYKGSVSYDTPMLYALGFIGLFTIGGLTGCFSRPWASTFTSMIPISSSPIFTTSWSEER